MLLWILASLILCVYVMGCHNLFKELDFKQTIGVDQDVWYYSITHDEPYRTESEQKMITFYTWDFAGQVHKGSCASVFPYMITCV